MKISVALCTFNGEKYISEQLDSILNQSVKVDEIIVCDDMSTDETYQILEKYKNDNPSIFKIFQNETNLKSVKNFEKAINLCSGNVIFLSDQDDIWTIEKVEKCVAIFNSKKDIEAIFTNAYLINQLNKKFNFSLFDSIYFNPKIVNKISLFEYLVKKKNVVTGATFCFKKNSTNEIFTFPELKNFHHDYYLALHFASQNKLYCLNENLTNYRLHDNQQVGTKNKTNKFKRFKTKLLDKGLFENRWEKHLMRYKINKHLKVNKELFSALKQYNPSIKFIDKAFEILK